MPSSTRYAPILTRVEDDLQALNTGSAGSTRTEMRMARPSPKTAAQHLVDALTIQGVDRVFCVPGESYLAVLDALHEHREDVQLIVCRHEGAAAMMAEADGKLTGRPGICMVTRGPGATNASAGIHVAHQDSTPLIVFVGQVARGQLDREAFQEIDYRRMFGQLTKWVAQIDRSDRVAEYISRAFSIAMSGRPGPVVLALPEDMLVETVELVAPAPVAAVEIHPSSAQLEEMRSLLAGAQRPLMIVGGSRWTADASAAVQVFAESNDLPVIASFRRQDRFDNSHPAYCGDIGLGANPKLVARVRAADLLLVVGAKLGEVPTGGYNLLQIPTPSQTLIHVHADADELGRLYTAALAINATPAALAARLGDIEPIPSPVWSEWRREARANYEAWQAPKPQPGKFDLGQAVLMMRDRLPEDAIFTNGAGNFSVWLHRFHRYRQLGTQLAPTSGSMGYGVPAAIAAKLRHPDRTVVCLAGDGDFQMSLQELSTAMQFGAAVLFIVVDNGIYGTIRMHQERHYPGRVSGTDMANPDFVTLAKAYGAHAEFVDRTEDFAEAFDRALAEKRTALIHVRVDPEALTPGQTLSQIRDQALSR